MGILISIILFMISFILLLYLKMYSLIINCHMILLILNLYNHVFIYCLFFQSVQLQKFINNLNLILL